jgi:hypothetical protein
MSKEITEADFVNLANDCVGIGLLPTGKRNYELAKSFAKQQSIEFFKWYGVKMVGFIEYIKDIRPTVTSDEIEEKIKEFEGQSIENQYNLFLQQTQKT